MAKSAEFAKTDGPIVIHVYNEDGTTHTHFARSRWAAAQLLRQLGVTDAAEVLCSKLFPNGLPSTSKSAGSRGSGSGRSRR